MTLVKYLSVFRLLSKTVFALAFDAFTCVKTKCLNKNHASLDTQLKIIGVLQMYQLKWDAFLELNFKIAIYFIENLMIIKTKIY
jgi:hypothetical protein